ncbi:MAG: SMC-Scp complex subunit ScpB [Bacilli bacterium]
MNKEAILEGLLFVVGDDGITIEQISSILEIESKEAKLLIDTLKENYEKENRGIRINFLGNNYKLTTKPEHKEYYQKLIEESVSNTLSNAALETLAIIAYNEPITRLDIDELRGVSSAHIIRKLVAKDLIKAIGRADTLGRPILYGITNDFLDYFGLASKEELPQIKQLNEVIEKEETDLFLARYQEDNE